MIHPAEMKQFLSWWKKRKIELKAWPDYTEEDIKYYVLNGFMIIDYSLVYDHEPFKLSIPQVLSAIATGDTQVAINLLQDITSWEKKKLKDGGASDIELRYVITLKNLANHILRKRGLSIEKRKKIIAGDHNRVTHYGVR